MINWNMSKEEMEKIDKIVSRAENKYTEINRMTLSMDLSACHLNDTRLNLDDFLIADDLDFFHDIFGIQEHINRNTGKLGGFFVPRFAEK